MGQPLKSESLREDILFKFYTKTDNYRVKKKPLKQQHQVITNPTITTEENNGLDQVLYALI